MGHTLQSGKTQMNDEEFKASLGYIESLSITNEQTKKAHAIFYTEQNVDLALAVWHVSL